MAPAVRTAAMNLLDLPVELFVNIIHEYVSAVGVHKAWKAREVCRAFAHLIDADTFSNQPLRAFVTCPRRARYLPATYSGVLKQNLGRFILARTQKPLDVDPQIPSTINRCSDFLMRFEDDATIHVERRLQIARELCDAAVGMPAYRLGGDVCHSLDAGWVRPSFFGPQESNIVDLLAASVVTSNRSAVSHCVQDGASPWQESNVFPYPLVISMLHTSDPTMTSYILDHIQSLAPVQKNEIRMMYWMFAEVMDCLVRGKRTDGVLQLLFWISGSALPPPDKRSFNNLLSTAIHTQDSTAVEAVLRIRIKSSPKVLWEHYQAVSQLGNPELLTALIEKGNFKVNRGFWSSSPLYDAVERGRTEFVRKLLEAGAYPDGPTRGNKTKRSSGFSQPLQVAVKGANLEMMDLLFEYGATLAGTDGDWNKEALFALAESVADARILQRLLLAQAKEEKTKPAIAKSKKKRQ